MLTLHRTAVLASLSLALAACASDKDIYTDAADLDTQVNEIARGAEAAADEVEGAIDELADETAAMVDEGVAGASEAAAETGAAATAALNAGPARVGFTAPDFTLADQNGTEHSLSDFRGKIVVLEWFNHGCPYVKKHYNEGHMQALQERYTDEGVVWLSICSSAEGKQGYTSGDDMLAMVAEKRMNSTAVMRDANGEVGRRYKARTTPHTFVIDTEGKLVYGGAIDSDSSADTSKIEGATNYVAETVDALLAGRAVESRETQSYGCGVKY